MPGQVLLVDDDPSMIDLLRFTLAKADIATEAAGSGRAAIDYLGTATPTAVVLDLLLPDMSGKDVLRWMREHKRDEPVVMLTSQDAVEDVVECMQLGAIDYVQKPFDRTRLVTSIRNAQEQRRLKARVETLARELRQSAGIERILGQSKALQETKVLLRKASSGDITVLLEGASGTGKEVAARAIHSESERRHGPFVAINCGAIPAGLIESELFGHQKGAFTGATAARPGRFEEAEGGTIFLDEIGELRSDLQVRLLRVLQERSVQRVGGSELIPLDVRVVAATNRNLKQEVAEARFRGDLYYRLAVFPVRLPPLCEREGDIRLLAEAFLEKFGTRHRRPLQGFTVEAMRALEAYAWPGNVRELENVLERAVILEDGERISLGSLPDEVVCSAEAPANSAAATDADVGAPIAGAVAAAAEDIVPLDEEERRIIVRALRITHGNLREAARRLGIGRATIYRKLERYGIAREPSWSE